MSSLRLTVRSAVSPLGHAAGARAARLCVLALLLACSDDGGSGPSRPPAPVTSIQVRTTTTGQDLDATGYVVVIGGGQNRAGVSANGSVTFFGFPVGNHPIGVADVAPNCTVTGGPFIASITSPGQTVVVDIQVVCLALGSVDVTVTVTGADPDADGFAVTEFYQRKRDLFLSLVDGSRFTPLESQGTFFQLLDYSRISTQRDEDFAVWMTKTHGVASIPLSPFLHGGEQAGHIVRFCFAKRDETLERAAERLRHI